jgi:XTP/dITP diphosphohydrolase
MSVPKICFASNNAHKLEEISEQLSGFYEIVSLKEIGCFEELPETGNTLESNSLEKAKYVADHYGIDCFADDTGLEIVALNGKPGVDTAHYAGPQRDANANMDLVLSNLNGKVNRGAFFKTVITLIEKGKIHTFTGVVAGKILEQRQGATGFGYDPIFQPEGFDRSFAEMTIEEKNIISHRGRAVAKLMEYLKK